MSGVARGGDAVVAAKEAAGRYAARLVEPGMAVGLGTGSTVHWTVVDLAEQALDIRCTATSHRTATLAASLGLTLVKPDDAGRLDLTVDGADEVDPQGNLTKGGGGAHSRERIVAEMADRFVVVVDESKLVDTLGPFGTPIEVLPFAPGVVADRLGALGATTVDRHEEPSDNGNVLLVAHFGRIDDPAAMSASLAAVPGVVDHGIFLHDTVHRVIVAGRTGVSEMTPGTRTMLRP